MISRRLIITFTAFFLLLMPLLALFDWSQLLAQGPIESNEPAPAQVESATTVQFLTGPAEGEPKEIALAYLKDNREALGLTEADLDELLLTDEYVTRHNQVTHLYFRQRLGGLEVVGGHLNINITPYGEIVNIGNRLVRCVTLEQCVLDAQEPTLSAVQAVQAAAAQLGLPITESLVVEEESDQPNQAMILNDGGLSLDPIPAKLVYVPLKKEGIRLAWEIVLRLKNGQNWLQLQVDALTGEIVQQQDWIDHEYWPSLAITSEVVTTTVTPTATVTISDTTVTPTATVTISDTTVTPTATVTISDTTVTPTATVTISDTTVTPTATVTISQTTVTPTATVTISQTTVTPTATATITVTVTNNLTPTDNSNVSDPTSLVGTRVPQPVITQPLTRQVDAPPSAYRVLPLPFSHPEDNSARFELITKPKIGQGSPFGWHDTDGDREPDFTDTRGNNVFVQEDANANDHGGSRPDGKEKLRFDFEFDPDLGPTEGENEEAALVNLFYMNNVLHDILYIYGFDEVSGNFQKNNYDSGGQEEDPLQADGLDGAGEEYANFGTPPDGQAPRMQMFISSVANRDSSFENQVIIHEYAHGVAERLTGGPSNVSCLDHDEQMSEGWSDWLALALTAKEGEKGDLNLFAPMGRATPYSTKLTDNPVTYGQLDELLIPYGVGYAWASMLWELHWVLVEQHDFESDWYAGEGGNQIALQLILDGMKLQPCHPTFTEARDAILLADLINNQAANQCRIWQAFAKRGLGLSADAGSPYSITDGREAFDMPPECELLNVTPVEQNICVGEETRYEVMVGEGYASAVRLDINANLASSSALFTPNPISEVPGKSQLLVSNTDQTAAGNYEITIIGSGGNEVANQIVELNIFEQAPDSPALIQPQADATDIPLKPKFEWAEVRNASQYILEVDNEPNFESIEYSATISDGTSHTAEVGLATQQTYYWRVRAQNPCGAGEPSAPASFTTGQLVCSRPNLDLADYTLVSDEIVIQDNGLITDLNVAIVANHRNVRDQLFTLSHLESGTSVTLINRPRCQGDNMNVLLDDKMPSLVDSTCQTGNDPETGETLAMTGALQPSQALSAFNFKPLAGTWRLSAADNASADRGTLQEWCLIPSTAAATGTLTGQIRDVESDEGIQGAVITAKSGPVEQVATTDQTGTYSMTLGVGSYNLSIAATSYLSNTVAALTIKSDQTTEKNVLLQGSSLLYDDAPIESSLEIGEIVTQTLTLNNNGPYPLTYTVEAREANKSCRIVNGDFETGNLAGWKRGDEREGWRINNHRYRRLADNSTLAPLAGQMSALSDQKGAGTSILYQDIELPDPLPEQVIVSWLDEWHNHATVFSDNQQFRVELYGPDGTTFLGQLFRTRASSPLISPLTRREVDITQWVTAYAGEKVRLAFVEEDTIDFFNVQIDGVQCQKSATWVTLPAEGSIPPHSKGQLDIAFDATSFYQTGTYAAELLFSGNFVNQVSPIALTMELDCSTCAKLTGLIRDIDTKDPLPATIRITSAQPTEVVSETTQSLLDVTLSGGEYELSVQPGAYEFFVRAEGYSDEVKSITAEANKTNVTDFNLIRAPATLDFTAPVISETLQMGEVAIVPVTIQNNGTVELEFSSHIKNLQTPEEASGSRASPPDEFGYIVIDSNNTNGPTYAFIDISDRENEVEATPTPVIEENQTTEATPTPAIEEDQTAEIGNQDNNQENNQEQPLPEPAESATPVVEEGAEEEERQKILLDDDQLVGPFPIGFEFDFYGTPQNEFYISSNGFISFDNTDPDLANQCRLPKASSPNNLIALMWDDLDPRDSRDFVYYQTFDACPLGEEPCLIVQYENYHHFPGGGELAGNFEAILFKNGDILLQYEEVGTEAGANATTGIENAAGSTGLIYDTCNSEYLTDQLAVCFAHPEGNRCGKQDWVRVNPARSTLAAGESTTIDIVLDAKSLHQVGDYSADLSFLGNFANQPDEIPVSMSLTCPDCDRLSGTISDAESNRPVTAEIVINGPGGFRTRLIGDQYDLPLLRGTYDLTAKADGYFEQSTTVTFREGISNTADFALEPDEIKLSFTPFLSQSVELGSVVSNTVTLSNSSPFDVQFNIQTQHLNRLESRQVMPAPFVLPANNNQFLPSEDAPASGVAPLRSSSAYQKRDTQKSGLSYGVLAYGLEALTKDLVYFDTNRQNKLTNQRSTGVAQIWGADFITGDFTTLYGLTADNQLIGIKIATGKTTILHEALPLEGHDWSAMAHDPLANVMYAASTNCKQSALYIINVASGAITPIGPIRNGACVTALAANEQGELYALDVAADHFLQVDPATGAGSVIGELGFDANFSQGMDFDAERNRLYLAAYHNETNEAQLRIVDPTTGNSSFVGAFGPPSTVQLNALAIPTGEPKAPSWTVLSPERGTIPANEAVDLNLLFNARSLYELGTYHANLSFTGNSEPDVANMQLEMDLYCDNCSVLNGSITDAESGKPLTANLNVTEESGFSTQLTGDEYQLTIQPGTYDFSVQASGYLSQTAVISATEATTVTTNFTLVPAVARIEVAPPVISEEMQINQLVTDTLTVENQGVVDLNVAAKISNYRSPQRKINQQKALDEFGYTIIDSNEPGGPTYNFIDIRERTGPSGTQVSLSDDEVAGPFPIGFDFNFYGRSQSEFYLSSNGLISFAAGIESYANPCSLSEAKAPNNLIALMWHDLDPGDTGDVIYHESFESCPIGEGACLIVQYQSYHHFPGRPDNVAGTFEAILFERGDILLQYADVGNQDGKEATIGLRNPEGTVGLSYNRCQAEANDNAVTSSLSDKLAICFAHPEGNTCGNSAGQWVSVSPKNSTIAPDESTNFNIGFNSSGLYQRGDYNAQLTLSGNFVNELGAIPITMPLTCPTCGYLDGLISDAETGEPVYARLQISGPNGVNLEFNRERYSIALPPETYQFSVQAKGYLSQSLSILPNLGVTTTTDFALIPATAKLGINQPAISKALQLGESITHTITISNAGAVDLDFNALIGELGAPLNRLSTESLLQAVPAERSVNEFTNMAAKTLSLPTELDEGALLFEMNGQSATSSKLLLGVEYANGNYFVTAAGSKNPDEPNLLYQLDANGNLLSSWTQPTGSKWGWYDLAFDGTYLYASDSEVIQQIDPETGQPTGVIIPSPTTPARALAYDPQRDTFWVANYDSPLYEIERDGEVINQFTNSLTISGLAWDQWSTNEARLWSWSQDGPNGHLATQINPEDGTLTGLAFKAARVRHNAGVAGGATIRQINEQLTFVGVQQLTSDLIVRYDLENKLTPIPWVKVLPEQGTLAPKESTQIQVIFDATNFHQRGDYNAELHLVGNFSNNVSPIQLAMQADCPRCASLNGSVSAAHTGNPLPATIRVTDDNNMDFSLKGHNYNLSVLPGAYNLSISANGYKSQTRTINVSREELTPNNFILDPLTKDEKASAIRLIEQATLGQPISRTLTLTDSTTIAFNLDLSKLLPNCNTLRPEQLATTTRITSTLNSDTRLNLNLNLQQLTLTENGISASLNFSALQGEDTFCIQEEEGESGRQGEGENGRQGEGENGRQGEGESGGQGEGENGRQGEGENGRQGEGESEGEGEGEGQGEGESEGQGEGENGRQGEGESGGQGEGEGGRQGEGEGEGQGEGESGRQGEGEEPEESDGEGGALTVAKKPTHIYTNWQAKMDFLID